MKVSLNTVKQYIDFELPPVSELVQRINQQLGGVEEVIDLADKYKDAVIVRVVECEKHANADRLNVTKIDDGGVVKDVERDDNGLVQVVCGAPNVHADMLAVWLPPRATVPKSYSDAQPFVLDTREIRGVMSNGMLAASDELALGSDHTGIVELDANEWRPYDVKVEPGAKFADAYGLNDTIIDIENKMFTHRPDLFGQLGVARELSAIIKGLPADDVDAADTRFSNPDWYWKLPEFASAEGLQLETFNDAVEAVPRVMFVAMNGVEIKPSPLWLQCALAALGSKSINNIVDVTNYAMLLTAQPTHAYDYDKLRGHKIGARMARDGETISLLNGKTYELTADDIVIADAEGPVGLGGIMGGADSEVSPDTKNIVLEVATFDMYAVRKTSMRHGLFTDALTRFNKGQSPLQNNRIIKLLLDTVHDVSGASQASSVYDLPKDAWTREVSLHGEIRVSASFINERLGLDLNALQIGNLLRQVNMASYPADDDDTTLFVTAPFWRTDIVQPEDIVEEVGRLYGFDKLPRVLPRRSLTPASKNTLIATKQMIRAQLARAGAREVLTYSFVHEKTITRAAQDPSHAYRLSNALSPDLQYYRLGITPSLLDKIHMNIKAGHEQFALFELNKVHFKGEMDEHEPSVPNEDHHLALVVTAKDKMRQPGAAYYLAKQYLMRVPGLAAVDLVPLVDFDLSTDIWGEQLVAPYDIDRSAVVVKDGQIWGVVGEYKADVAKAYKLPEYTAGFEINLGLIQQEGQSETIYRPLSRYPSVIQDISLRVKPATKYQDILLSVRAVVDKLHDVDVQLEPVSIYSPKDNSSKTLSFRLTVTNHDRTLSDKYVSKIMSDIESHCKEAVGASRI